MLVVAVLLAGGAIYLSTFAFRGWIPHDEGLLGNTAELALEGRLPHVDFEDPYTGLLTWLHAGAFALLGTDLAALRYLLYSVALGCFAILYLLFRRWLTPVPAAIAAWTGLVWSFPNYFASLPSWYLLVLSIATLWLIFKYWETGRPAFALAAGLVAGISVLIKQTGLFLVAGLAMGLVGPVVPPIGTWVIAVGGSLLAALLLSTRPGAAELLNLLLPILACAFIATRWKQERRTWRELHRSPAIYAALISSLPVAALAAVYAGLGHGERFVSEVFIRPSLRLEHASLDFPPWGAAFAALPVIMLVLAPGGRWVRARSGQALLTAVAATLVVASFTSIWAYQIIWQFARTLAPLVAVGFACLASASDDSRGAVSRRTFAVLSVASWISLNQFPFSGPNYFCYVSPVWFLAAVAFAEVYAPARFLIRPIGLMLLLFGILVLNAGYVENVGLLYLRRDLNHALDLDRASLTVSSRDAAQYRRVVALVNAHLESGGRLLAGPDAPELYFLTRQEVPAGRMYAFFGDENDMERALDSSAQFQVVVVNFKPGFSPSVDPSTLSRIRTQFPHGERVGTFEVRWK